MICVLVALLAASAVAVWVAVAGRRVEADRCMHRCPECGVGIQVSMQFAAQRVSSGDPLFCPLGHQSVLKSVYPACGERRRRQRPSPG